MKAKPVRYNVDMLLHWLGGQFGNHNP
jgi:hypothetical protein